MIRMRRISQPRTLSALVLVGPVGATPRIDIPRLSSAAARAGPEASARLGDSRPSASTVIPHEVRRADA